MRRGLFICLWCILGGTLLPLNAQEPQVQDSVLRSDSKRLPADTVKPLISEKAVVLVDSVITISKHEFKPDSKKAVIYSAIFPGLGQFYNRKYWKLPIVYGGALGLTYAITWNGRVYNDYNQAFRDLVTGSGTSYTNYLRPGQTVDDYGRDRLQSALKSKKDFYRRNRDLAIIAAVGVYALCMIDAYVDAQLYDFDMSPDLSMRVTPVFWPATSYSKASVGLQCSINF
ncbi:DUF5683 domain-containing protein [uncultured Dysgonomonas sp.]|uniref:DUF5683 domain-containing protein n=1 Tax=uncultured Dysgonomonas sp. TaxID=206096 RepID=A0A212J9C8_9BACT|nr:DUF5683 domain-containing protein [uncultured Dysgonomonas sp.]SBV96053.1 conserved membrane hypothetical protein [uncultured Dysgonomonas sp.]